MDKDIAIQVNNVSKTFKIPHEKVTSVRGVVVSGLSKLSFKGSQSSAFGAKTYEEFKALDDVSFEVKKGEFFGIIGGNETGNSALARFLTVLCAFAKIKLAKITRPDPWGMAGFVL